MRGTTLLARFAVLLAAASAVLLVACEGGREPTDHISTDTELQRFDVATFAELNPNSNIRVFDLEY
ncbi:MAG: hypothetical protein CL731_07630 [Chloroflexi bacterium]|nr:hypothetical protein [Chloroflexota bacterium]